MEKSLPQIPRSLVYVSLFSPLIVLAVVFFPFIVGKAIFFRLAVTLASAAAVYLCLSDSDYRPKKSPVLWSLLTLLVVSILATIFSVDPFNSFWSNYERMEGLLSYFYLAGYFFTLITVFNTEQLWRRLIQTSVGVSVLIGLYGVGQLLGWFAINQGGVRVDATFGNATYLAIYMVFNFGFLVWLWAGKKDKHLVVNLSYGLIGLLQLFTLYHTATRGAILGLIVGALVASLFVTIFSSGLNRKVAGSVIAIAFLIVVGFFVAKDTSFIQESPVLSRFASISLSDTTTESRITIWQMGLKGVSERPVFGYGPENFGMVFSRYYEPKLWRSEPWFDRAHNVVMDWLVNTGVVGLGAYLSVFIAIVWALLRRRYSLGVEQSAVLLGLLAAYFVHNFFVFDNLVSYQMFLILAGLVYFYSSENNEPILKTELFDKYKHIVIGIVALVFLASAYFFVLIPYSGATNIINGFRAIETQPGDTPASLVNRNVDYFKKAIDSPLGRKQTREYLFEHALSVARIEGMPAVQQQQIIMFAYQEGLKQIQESPDDVRFLLIFGGFLADVGQLDQSIELLEKAAELAPNKQQVLITLARALISSDQPDDISQGMELLKQAFELAPDYDQARLIYGNALDYFGRTDEAREILAPLDTQ